MPSKTEPQVLNSGIATLSSKRYLVPSGNAVQPTAFLVRSPLLAS